MKMKYLLGAVALVASLSAFTVPVKVECPGEQYVYQGTGDPNEGTEEDFVLASIHDCNGEAEYRCRWYKEGETFLPCPDGPTGKYTPPARAASAK
jgi:hypothetical protein